TEAAHTPVSTLGKMLSTTRRPASDSEVTGERSEPTRSTAGAVEPTAGSSPDVVTGLPLNAVVAIHPFYRTPGCPVWSTARHRYHEATERYGAQRAECSSISAGVALCSSPRVRSDRKSTRLNSSHVSISYAVFC